MRTWRVNDKTMIELSAAELHALCMIAGNGWGDGDFAGWGKQHIPTQKRVLRGLQKASDEAKQNHGFTGI
jgi:hypothetical protein